jgi:hypothetical protein
MHYWTRIYLERMYAYYGKEIPGELISRVERVELLIHIQYPHSPVDVSVLAMMIEQFERENVGR